MPQTDFNSLTKQSVEALVMITFLVQQMSDLTSVCEQCVISTHRCSFNTFINSTYFFDTAALTLQRVKSPSSLVILNKALNTLVYLRCCSTGSLQEITVTLVQQSIRSTVDVYHT